MEWVLWNPAKQTALVIIPEEAELLIPTIRQGIGRKEAVHLITYMAPLARDMLPFDSLSFYALPPLSPDHQHVPEWLSMELGVFAGRTFAGSTDCLALRTAIEHHDGAMLSSASPFAFLFEWLTLRRKGQDITHTPMGHVCRGRPLSRDHYFFVGHAEPSSVSAEMAQDSDNG